MVELFTLEDDDPELSGRPHATTFLKPSRPDERLVLFMSSILRAGDIETIWAQTCEYMHLAGFGEVIYGYSPTFHAGNIGLREEVLLLSTLERRVVDALVDDGHYRESVTFDWALRNVGVASWSMSAEEAGRPGFESSPTALDFFAREGFESGCTIGFPSARRRGRAVMALLGRKGCSQEELDQMIDRLGDSLHVAASMAHMRLSEMPYIKIKARNGLTARQREVLEWVAEGKTVADIAAILGISPVTVDKHLRLARETLGVETTAQAVIKATFLNQLFVYQPLPPEA